MNQWRIWARATNGTVHRAMKTHTDMTFEAACCPAGKQHIVMLMSMPDGGPPTVENICTACVRLEDGLTTARVREIERVRWAKRLRAWAGALRDSTTSSHLLTHATAFDLAAHNIETDDEASPL